MDGKETLENLIVSYLLGELDQEKQEWVREQIRSDAQWRQAYDDLRKMVQLVGFSHTSENVDLDREWLLFEEARVVKEHPELFLHEAERFGNGVIKEIRLKRKTRILKIVSMSAVAASLILATGWALTFFAQQKTVRPAVATVARRKNEPAAPAARQLINHTTSPKQYLLQDGTTVLLSAGSEVGLQEPFEPGRRDVYLTGNATFQVAKDKARPFTVYSGGISTTALGTRFTVTAFKNSNHIRVVLHEGKVVVKGVGDMRKKVRKDYYLVAGQEFVWENRLEGLARVQNTESDAEPMLASTKAATSAELTPERPSIPSLGKTSWYMFNNKSLPHVFNQLMSIYETEIIYNRADLEKKYFIGTFNQGDSLETVLKQIAILNGLRVTREHQKFIVTKQD